MVNERSGSNKVGTQAAFRNIHKRVLVGEPPWMGPRRFRKAACEATGSYLTTHILLRLCFRASRSITTLCAVPIAAPRCSRRMFRTAVCTREHDEIGAAAKVVADLFLLGI